MSETKSRNVLAIAAATLATGALAYVVYFDYKRRNDAQFRRKLRKEKKRVDKTVAHEKETSTSSAGAAPSGNVTTEMLRAALDQVKTEEPPQSTEEKEAYFMTQVGMGEQLAAQGPQFYLPAAIAFYKALRVYPSPVELIVIYQKTVPEPLFKLIIDLTNMDVAARASGYYDHFPPKSMNVEVKPNENGRKVLLVTKDIAAGETIYKEFPVVAVLDADLEASSKFCSHCFRPLDPTSSTTHRLPEESNPLGSTFCSEQCLNTSKAQSTSLLFTQEPPLPPELAPGASPALDVEGRKAAQDKFVEYLKKEKGSASLLVARFIARQVALETAKLAGRVPGSTAASSGNKVEGDFTDADEGEYLLADHMERMRYLEVKPNEQELPLISAVLEKTLPGLEQFVTEERHATLLGKMMYNAIGVGRRDDKPESTARPEDVEKTRTPFGTQSQIGSAFYTLSSYANHSCAPSAKLTFPLNTTELHVVATKDLKKGDELTVAYVDVDTHETEAVVDARRRRRVELARGWRFACPCERCVEEANAMSQEEKDKEGDENGKDESKIEESARNFEEKEQELRAERAAERAAEVE